MRYWVDKDYQFAMKKLKEAHELPDNFVPKEAIIEHWQDVAKTTKNVIIHEYFMRPRLHRE